MPDAKNNAKATGDTHPPEIEERGAPRAGGASGGPPDRDLGQDLEHEGRAGQDENQAGLLKDKDAAKNRDKP